MANPSDQFIVKTLIPLRLGGIDMGFTNAALMMALATVAIGGGLILATSSRALIPGRAQALAEMLYEFVARTLTDATGREGMRFLPLIFSLFMFVLVLNLFGMVPGAFTVTSHIVVTFALAMLVMATVVGYGAYRHGLRFLRLFVPSDVPGWLLPFITVIEIVSFLSRPISLSLRLFANLLGGHIALKVFGSFVAALLAAGFGYGLLAPLPLLMTVALTAFEFLVAVLQAYVFTVLACIYLNDALHPGH
ncbi:F0F1 ATP synthase subunit A [Bosea sp. NBC_00550]|uniref:F0F1 ATP synthase subunit A n=1 Tax=Bosea sp. NBC_00550 TaxID=2969621 RepID=UPI00223194F1|nr:F0F1 ATP synthase subunit A [Bosea sp. NBC_00550]UZF90316.1 F0F1 ATP synthase subunit A [Bosea sp. NBC_00550]